VSTHRRAGAITVTVGAAVLLIGTFLTWLQSGERDRSSYDLFGLVDRLGFSEGGVVGWALRLWPLVPLLLVATVITWWSPFTGTCWSVARGGLVVVAALYAGGIAVAVRNAPDVALFTIGPGPLVTAIGSLVMVAGAALSFVLSRRAGGQRTVTG
jgi:hypothetical protein